LTLQFWHLFHHFIEKRDESFSKQSRSARLLFLLTLRAGPLNRRHTILRRHARRTPGRWSRHAHDLIRHSIGFLFEPIAGLVDGKLALDRLRPQETLHELIAASPLQIQHRTADARVV